MNARPLAALGALLLAACATPDTGRIAGAATSPLHDLNLLKTDLGFLTMSALAVNDVIGWVLFAIILGMLLALPIAAVANVLLRFATERYTQSDLYAGERPGIALDTYIDKSVLIETPPRDAEEK